MNTKTNDPSILGYVDRLSARPGEVLEFKVSSASMEPFNARLVRSISADPNPDGPGIVEEDASQFFSNQSFASIHQPFAAGSYGVAESEVSAKPIICITFSAIIFPTLLTGQVQIVLSFGRYALQINQAGAVSLKVDEQTITIDQPVKLRQWYRITAKVTHENITVQQVALGIQSDTPCSANGKGVLNLETSGIPTVAASVTDDYASLYFNGKIEAPSIKVDDQSLCVWDFTKDISTTTAFASTGPNLKLVNFPARAVTGSSWDGTEMNWSHKPSHYGAIHFHEDDIYDFEWETSFTFLIPDGISSGVYIMRLECDGHEDAIPFFVCAPLGKPKAKLCVLISTMTYAIYGNHARPDYDPSWQDRINDWDAYPYNPAVYPEYGLSTYNYHSDGSGICHASHRRPLFNLKPGYITFGDTPCSGLRHFPADMHLISWLHAQSIDYDLISDQELHNDGVETITDYKAVTTATHPEYHTTESLNALRDYRDSGGNLLYLGGTGFYWRVAVHTENDSLLEIRRAEDGIRAWAAEPGEYYNAFDGGYGGLWRRNGRAPQQLVGIGFAAQGEFFGDPYRRVCTDPDYNWVFEGIKGDLIGDFGLSGNGAAGFELDHIDYRLGTLETTVLLARSVTRDTGFMLVPEEQLTHLTNLTGDTAKDAMHADMIYTEYPNGGCVFATGSITFCGSLPSKNFDNNVSRLLKNVMQRLLD